MNNNIKIGSYIEDDYFYWDGMSTIPKGTTRVRVKADVKEIPNDAFKDNLELEWIDFLNNNLERIGDYAFYGCKNLCVIANLKDEITKIGLYAFKNTPFEDCSFALKGLPEAEAKEIIHKQRSNMYKFSRVLNNKVKWHNKLVNEIPEIFEDTIDTCGDIWFVDVREFTYKALRKIIANIINIDLHDLNISKHSIDKMYKIAEEYINNYADTHKIILCYEEN